jgi:hypothetical protein
MLFVRVGEQAGSLRATLVRYAGTLRRFLQLGRMFNPQVTPERCTTSHCHCYQAMRGIGVNREISISGSSTTWAIDHAARSSRVEGPDAFKALVACSLRSSAIDAAEPSTHARAILRLGKQRNKISLMFSEASPYIVHSIHRRPRPMSAFLP